MFILTIKPNFLALFLYFMVLFWLFMGYFDKMFVTYIITGLGASILFDLIFILFQFTGFVNSYNPTGSGLVVFLVVLLVVELALRIIMILKMMPFKTPGKKMEYF